MKGDGKLIDYLNKILKNELTSINQYFVHARMFKNWGLHKLDEYEFRESLDEMKHADRLIERILFLDGLPNLQDLGKLMLGENVKEMLTCDLKLENNAMTLLREAIPWCESSRDFVSRSILEEILHGEEEHVDWLETQLELIEKLGIENYLLSMR